jgi:fructan beta-fructosidase
MNDPNGLVYYEREYHLFYQHNPDDVVWGPMHWGHAVSTDLVHWEHLPIALYPDANGAIWSGSAVVDADNTSGLVPGGGLVAIFSYQDQTQGIAYSQDRGRTWQMYEDNPVLPALETDFRDPKVFWHEDTQKWVMVISAKKVIKIFTSENLINWDFASDFADVNFYGGVWEVPDLFALTLDGEEKWVMLVSINPGGPAGGSATRYYIGDFDGQVFTDNYPHELTWLDYGADNYAGTTWSNTPDHQRLFIGWMNNWLYAGTIPTSVWRGATTLVREFDLVNTPNGARLRQTPVTALAQFREPIGMWEDIRIDDTLTLDLLRGNQLEIIADFEPGTAERFGIELFKNDRNSTRVLYNMSTSQLVLNRPGTGTAGQATIALAPLEVENNRIRIHIFVDRSSVEVFGNDGLTAITSQVFPEPGSEGVALFTELGSARLLRLEAYEMESIWSQMQVEKK